MPRHRVPMTTLATDQSQFNASPFAKLHNLAMREAGMVEPLPGRAQIALNIGSTGHDVRRIWAVKDQDATHEIALLRNVAGASFQVRAIAASSSSTPTIASASLLGLPCGLTEARQRVFYAGPRGVLVLEDDCGEARMLGMQPPTWLGISGKTTTDAQAVPATSRVAWRATIHRTASVDEYEMFSAPSYAMYAESTASITDFTLRIGWPTAASASDQRVRLGDVVKLWRARAVAAGTSTNDRYLLTASTTVSGTDLTNRYVEIRDVTPDAALASGEELYTNPGAQGALAANWQLGPCTDVAVYNGHAFYAERSLPAFADLRVPSAYGNPTGTAQRARGIGVRLFSGDTTITSPTVAGVSAAELSGLSVGQMIIETVPTVFAIGTKILSINTGAGTVTMNANASATQAGALITVTDTFTVNGEELRVYNLASLAYDAWLNDLRAIFTFNELVDGEGLTTSFAIDNTTTLLGVSIRIDMIAPEGVAASDLAITATNGANYSPAIVGTLNGTIDERLNRAKYAKLDQPDHVPAVSELVVGKDEIIRFLSTQDRLFVFCSDGCFAITGNESAWSVDRVDKDIVIASQAAADEMNGSAYVYANDRGLLRIDNGGIVGLSKGAIQKQLNADIKSAKDDGVYEAHVVCDALHDEVGVFFQSPPGSA